MLSVEPSVRRGTELFEQFKRERGVPSLSERHAGSPEARRGAKLVEQRKAKRFSSLLHTPKQIRRASDPDHVIQPPGTVVGKATRTGTNTTRSFATPVSSDEDEESFGSFFSDVEGALKMEGRVADAVRAGGPNPFASVYEAAGRPMDASSSSAVSQPDSGTTWLEDEARMARDSALDRRIQTLQRGLEDSDSDSDVRRDRGSAVEQRIQTLQRGLADSEESEDEAWSTLEHGKVTHAPVGLHVAPVKHAAAANKKPTTYTKDSSMDKLV